MLDFDAVLELMKKYGYSSTSVHPYIYQNGDNLGICYTYNDDEYGLLERIKLCDSLEEVELFLKQLDFIKQHGKELNLRMVLDNYESINPKVVFLRNEKILLEGEMFDTTNRDLIEEQRKALDEVTQLVYKAGDLLLIYDEVKERQLQYLRSTVTLKNILRTKYFDLQKEIDIYNKFKMERELKLLPDVHDIGINNTMEIAIKDRYNMYVAQSPTKEEALDFLREVWDLNKNLELNSKYYEALREENNARNELKVVNIKLDLMKKLNSDYRPLFGIDLVSRFRKINKECNLSSNMISDSIIQENIDRIERKYAVYDNLDVLATSDYLRESMQNTNYGDLVIKYAKGANRDMSVMHRMPLNEVAASLSIQYRDRLDVMEQAILVLYNNHKYRKLCNAILEIENIDTLPMKKIISKISGIKDFSKIKTECYDIVKKRLDDPLNSSIKTSLFNGYDFTTFETFITSLIRELKKLKNINNKMIINGNINMYLQVKKGEDISLKNFIMVTNDLNGLLSEIKGSNNLAGIVLLKENTPVLYSPYYFDVGDIYSKDASPQMFIREMINFELLLEKQDIVINMDPVKTNVVRYYSDPVVSENVTIVKDIMVNFKTTFCKFAFSSNILGSGETVYNNSLTNNVVTNIPLEVNNVIGNNTISQESDNSISSSLVADNNLNNVSVNSNNLNETDNKVDLAPVLESKEPVLENSNSSLDGSSLNTLPVDNTANKENSDVESKTLKVPEEVQSVNKVIDKKPNENLNNNVVKSSIGKPVVKKPVATLNSGGKQIKPVGSAKPVVSNPNIKPVSPVSPVSPVNPVGETNKEKVNNNTLANMAVKTLENNEAKKVVVNSLNGTKAPKGKVVVNTIGTPVKKVVGNQVKVGKPQIKVGNPKSDGKNA